MKSTEHSIRATWSAGDAVFAFYGKSLDGHNLINDGIPAPVRGMFVTDPAKAIHEGFLRDGFTSPKYFAETSPATGAVDWNRTHKLDGWDFADTEAEIADIRKMRISEAIRKKELEIKALTDATTPVEDNMTDKNDDADRTIWRVDPIAGYEAIREAMNLNMTLKPDFEDVKPMSWQDFTKLVRSGAINDYDGRADLRIDGHVASNALLALYMEMLYVYDRYLVPFDRVPELFEGHEIDVLWFSK